MGLALASMLVAATWAVSAKADDQQALEFARNPFDAGRYEEAHARLSALLDPALPVCDSAPTAGGQCRLENPDLIERARAFDAASLLALKREAEADAQIARILRQNPQYGPSPATFPQEVIDRFTLVRGSLRAELEAIEKQKAREELAKRVLAQKAREAEEQWIAELARLAGEERSIRVNSRWVAMVPFGVGQFQNGDTRLGVAFAVAEAVLGGTALVSIGVYNGLAATDMRNGRVPYDEVNYRIQVATLVNQIAFTTWALTTVAGIIQAQAAFVPNSISTRKRPVPPRPVLQPVVAGLPGGAFLGVVGSF